ncbi:MAG: alginate export family protein [Xanthomonadales bacterium]|nr:hypothetical protein [Xanthomonadales bacterium]MCC6592147.1 alginate export family protein [Xanthomonadales bacterium]MCE7931143.1 hypothetical protein [Xanthomonadales bacterium PRO6]
MNHLKCQLLYATLALVLSSPAPGAETAAAPAPELLVFEWNARMRHESVDDDAFARTAQATTLRLRLGTRANFGKGWSALIEGEGIAALDDSYNSGANGQTTRPAIIDPDGAELNQVWAGWRGSQFAATLGRQRVALDHQRWVGNVGWRQNEQTFDAVGLEWKPVAELSARYYWLDRVHRVGGDDARDRLARERRLNTHLLDLSYAQSSQAFGAYVYAHEDEDVPGASSLTTGARWTANHVKDGRGWNWRVEAAWQGDRADNPLEFSHRYWLLEPAYTWRGIAWRAGWEHLGGDGRHALQTPLATLHAFNGWADQFLATPAAGLEDRYIGAGGALGKGERSSQMKWAVLWHDYRADRGDARYGSEWDASLSFPIHGKLTGLVKLADYRSDEFARDTTKFWLQLEWVM